MTRKYRLGARAEQQEETRLRIIEATVELHQEIGGPATTVSAIAERAGVERATVYRHFPDEHALLQACTGHYMSQNPPPNPQIWGAIENGETRLRIALAEIYAYHRNNEVMLARAEIDVPQMPTLRAVLAPMFAYWAQVRDLLAAPWQAQGENGHLVTAAIGHAVAFQTWQSLARDQGLDDDEAVNVMLQMVKCVAEMK